MSDSSAIQTLCNTILGKKTNVFKSVSIMPKDYASCPSSEFHLLLETCLAGWQSSDLETVWFTSVTLDKTNVLGALYSAGFVARHVDPADGSIFLVKKIAPDAFVPERADASVNSAGLVINSKGETVVVKESRSTFTQDWKLPGGKVNDGENIMDAAVREVFEETGLRTKAIKIICFRQMYMKTLFGGQDLYFVVLLQAEDESQPLVPDPKEIAEVRWMPLTELAELPGTMPINKHVAKLALNREDGAFVCSEVLKFDLKDTYPVYGPALD